MEIVIGVVAKVAEYMVGPIVRRCPFKNLWDYRSNLENLKTELKKLEAERVTMQGLTIAALPDLNDWLDKATNTISEVSRLVSEGNAKQQTMGCCEGCACSNLKECCQHRNNVARKLRDVAQLLQQSMESKSLWEYKSYLEKLKKEVEKLEAKSDTLKYLIKAQEEPLPDVKLWQDKVTTIIGKLSGITSQHNPQQQNNPAQMLNDVAQLLHEFNEFKNFSFRPIPVEPWLQSSKGYDPFESRTLILKKIIEAFSKPDVGLVGIFGMGGIGKTTLAKQIARESKDKLFDKIVFVEVSQTPDIKKLQGEIGSSLGLNFHEADESSERARRIFHQLKNEGKTLLILDNIWESLNLESLGIPYKDDSKGLKLLMTARKRDVLTDGMEYSQHIFCIGVLEWPDAWSLFKSKAGTCVDRHELLDIAVDVAQECGGVPLAIVTIATTLCNKGREEWNTVFRKLKNPSLGDFVGEEAKVYQSIELSFNYLETEELKETFLLCSSMGRTYDASIEDLLRYGIGLGLFNRFNTMEEERDNVCLLIRRLKDSSLLVDATKSKNSYQLSNVGRFAMHDVVCDVARLIAGKHKNVLNVIDDVIPRSWESENMLRNCTSITLHDVNELSEDLQLVCPQLKFFYVKHKLFTFQQRSKISNKFFAWMPKLQVLHLINMDLQSLSTSLGDLINLRTLCLKDCVLKDIADVGDLKNLEILSFRSREGLKVPEKLTQLTKLRLLELNSSEFCIIPSEFILSFKKLEALYLNKHASYDELEHLFNLTSLEIQVQDATMLRGLLSSKLKRYNITIGFRESSSLAMNRLGWDIQCTTSRFLQVKLNTNENEIISGLKAIRQLVLDEAPCLANNFCDLDGMGFPELEDLKVQNNSHIIRIVDTISHNGAFPILKSLILWNLINLKSICNGPLGRELFHQLRTIRVGKCDELINVFSFVSDRVFEELKEIEVLDCKNMEGIFTMSEQVHEIKLSKLSILKLTSLPRLKSLCRNVKTTTLMLPLTSHTKPGDIILEEEQDVSKPLFNDKVVVTNLETLEIVNVNVEMIWDNQLPMMSTIQNLTCLIISNLPNLKGLGSGDYIKFPSLKEMTIESCPKFKEFFFDDKVGVPSLEKIKIVRMDNLKIIWHNQLAEDSFPKLKSLQVEGCQMLLTLFGLNMCQNFLSLETLDVSRCGSLKEILDLRGLNFEEQHCTTSTQSGEHCTSNPQLLFSFANLHKLEVSECRRLKNLFYAKKGVVAKESSPTAKFVFPELTTLDLQKLPELGTFYPGRYTMEWPVLKLLKMNQCGIDDINEDNEEQQMVKRRWGYQRYLQQQQKQVVCQFEVGQISPNLLLTMSSLVPNLTMLIVYHCRNLEELFPYSMMATEELKEQKTGNSIVFPKLNYIEIGQLANLKGLCSGCHIEFPTLKEFTISNCPELTAFIFDDKIRVPTLEKIRILSMDNLEMIWHNQFDEDSFPKLRSFQVEGCQKLLTLFQSNVYGKFLNLETLHVCDCGSLKEIFNLHEINSEERQSTTLSQSLKLCTIVLSFANLQDLKVSECGSLKNLFLISNVSEERGAVKEAHATTKFVFPKLTSLVLSKLPQLRTFYPARCTVEWPILRRLDLWDCGILNTDDEDQIQHLFFLLEKAIPCLEEWILAGRELTMMWRGDDPERLFRNFEILYVHDESKVGYWSYEDRPVLQYMGNMEYMWRQNFKLDLILSNFKKIVVRHCDSFFSQMPPSASFEYLTNLEVCDCNSLEHIGTFTMAKSLVMLVHLAIRSCKMVVDVVGNHGDVIEDRIILISLKSLSLEDLPSLTSFCSCHCTLEFPYLEQLELSKCPNMKIFSLGNLKTPKLHRVQTGYDQSIELCPNVDVNTAIQELQTNGEDWDDQSNSESE